MALDMHDIGKAIFETSQQIQKGVKSLYGHAKAYAEAEQEYRLALAKEIIRLRDEKMPVSLINDVARGNLADLKYKRDLGMGMDRRDVDDSGHRKICLCREHHTEAHQIGRDSFQEKYHVYGIMWEG